jgi:hypothetical protein
VPGRGLRVGRGGFPERGKEYQVDIVDRHRWFNPSATTFLAKQINQLARQLHPPKSHYQADSHTA